MKFPIHRPIVETIIILTRSLRGRSLLFSATQYWPPLLYLALTATGGFRQKEHSKQKDDRGNATEAKNSSIHEVHFKANVNSIGNHDFTSDKHFIDRVCTSSDAEATPTPATNLPTINI